MRREHDGMLTGVVILALDKAGQNHTSSNVVVSGCGAHEAANKERK